MEMYALHTCAASTVQAGAQKREGRQNERIIISKRGSGQKKKDTSHTHTLNRRAPTKGTRVNFDAKAGASFAEYAFRSFLSVRPFS